MSLMPLVSLMPPASRLSNQRRLIEPRSLTQINESNACRCAKYAVFGQKGTKMLSDLNVDQARFIAILAGSARRQRDLLLGNVPQQELGGSNPGRGEHNPTAAMGFEALPSNESQ